VSVSLGIGHVLHAAVEPVLDEVERTGCAAAEDRANGGGAITEVAAPPFSIDD
jgi:hypothetical protein